MMDKIVEYSVKFAVPQSKLSQHQKNFEALIHKFVNNNSSMKSIENQPDVQNYHNSVWYFVELDHFSLI